MKEIYHQWKCVVCNAIKEPLDQPSFGCNLKENGVIKEMEEMIPEKFREIIKNSEHPAYICNNCWGK